MFKIRFWAKLHDESFEAIKDISDLQELRHLNSISEELAVNHFQDKGAVFGDYEELDYGWEEVNPVGSTTKPVVYNIPYESYSWKTFPKSYPRKRGHFDLTV